jgi:hypothetical protein
MRCVTAWCHHVPATARDAFAAGCQDAPAGWASPFSHFFRGGHFLARVRQQLLAQFRLLVLGNSSFDFSDMLYIDVETVDLLRLILRELP